MFFNYYIVITYIENPDSGIFYFISLMTRIEGSVTQFEANIH